jgi:hypothetical protein
MNRAPVLECISRRCAGKSVLASDRVVRERESKYVSRQWPLCESCIDSAEAVARRWGHRAPSRTRDFDDAAPDLAEV